MFLTKLKLGTAAVLCTGLFIALIGGSVTSAGSAQDAKPRRDFINQAEAQQPMKAGDPAAATPDARQTKSKKVEKEPGVVRGALDQVDAQENRITVTLPGTRGIKNGELVTGKSVRLENLPVGKSTKITVDGKEGKLAQVNPGMTVTLELEIGFGQIAIKKLDAGDNKKQ